MTVKHNGSATEALQSINDLSFTRSILMTSSTSLLSTKKRSRPMIDLGAITKNSNSRNGERVGTRSSPLWLNSSNSNSSSLKRSRSTVSLSSSTSSSSSSSSSSSTFDMTDFSDASRHIEESIAFPEIVFPFDFDDDDHVNDDGNITSTIDDSSQSVAAAAARIVEGYDDDDDDDEQTTYLLNIRPTKRRRVLTRCNQRSTSLWEMWNTATATMTSSTV